MHPKNENQPFPNKIISEQDLKDIKHNMSLNGKLLLIEYLGDFYFYKKIELGNKFFFEYYYTLTYD